MWQAYTIKRQWAVTPHEQESIHMSTLAHSQCHLVQLGYDFLIILGCGSQLCQMNLLFPLLLFLYLQNKDEGGSAVAFLHDVRMQSNKCCIWRVLTDNLVHHEM